MCPTERCETGGCPECRTQCKPPTCSPRCSAPPVSWGALMAGAALLRTPAPCLPLARQAPSCNILCDEPKCEAPRDRLCRDAAARLTLLVSPPPLQARGSAASPKPAHGPSATWSARPRRAAPAQRARMGCESPSRPHVSAPPQRSTSLPSALRLQTSPSGSSASHSPVSSHPHLRRRSQG